MGYGIGRSCIVVARKRRIALALPMGVPHLEEVVYGIQLYGQSQAGWDYVTSPETHSIPVSSLSGWDGDGVIAMVSAPADLGVVKRLKCPVVNLSGAIAEAGLPRVRVNYELAGQLAAEHLLSRGFERFAFYGLKDIFFSRSCLDGFRKRIERHSGMSSVYEDASTYGVACPWQHDRDALAGWLKSLELPIGLMASHDPRAVMVLQACRRIGLRVPDDVAVIGFNNDIQSCEFCEPPLTSVARPGVKIGFEAAALLDRLIHGAPAPAEDILFPPEGVVERASTNTLAVGDNEVLGEAIRFIHQNLSQPVGVEEILKHIDVSRRWLEMAFKNKLHTSPHVYISQARVKKAKSLLEEPRKLRLKQVAQDCGFSGTRQLSVIFKRFAGVPLREYAARFHAPRRPAPDS